MKRFTMVFGTNGVGKTTLVKNILMSDQGVCPEEECLFDGLDYYEYNCDYGRYTLSKGGSYVAIGSYANKCGGADSIRDSFNYYAIIRLLAERYPSSDLFVEGVMTHSVDKLCDLFDEFKSNGYEVTLVYLKSTLDKAVERVCGRNGKNPNVDTMRSKIESVENQFKTYVSKYKTLTIDVTEKTPEEVFDEFMKDFEEE